jgi:membrane protease YdiL (CAAX protease family)
MSGTRAPVEQGHGPGVEGPVAYRPVLFVVLAYVLSWAWVVPLAAVGATVVAGRGWPTHGPALFGPMLAALVCAALAGRATVRDLLRRMVRWRIGARWWLAAVSPALALGAVLGMLAIAGVGLPAAAAFGGFSGLPSSWGVAPVVAAILLGALGEETGWRGWLLPALQRRSGPVTASLLVAVVWAGWHLPQFFLIRSYEQFPVAMLPVFVLGLAGGSVVLTWLYNRTRSILAVAVWHGLYNVAGATTAANQHGGVISAAIWTFVVLFAVVLLLLERRAGRAGRPSVMGAR